MKKGSGDGGMAQLTKLSVLVGNEIKTQQEITIQAKQAEVAEEAGKNAVAATIKAAEITAGAQLKTAKAIEDGAVTTASKTQVDSDPSKSTITLRARLTEAAANGAIASNVSNPNKKKKNKSKKNTETPSEKVQREAEARLALLRMPDVPDTRLATPNMDNAISSFFNSTPNLVPTLVPESAGKKRIKKKSKKK